MGGYGSGRRDARVLVALTVGIAAASLAFVGCSGGGGSSANSATSTTTTSAIASTTTSTTAASTPAPGSSCKNSSIGCAGATIDTSIGNAGVEECATANCVAVLSTPNQTCPTSPNPCRAPVEDTVYEGQHIGVVCETSGEAAGPNGNTNWYEIINYNNLTPTETGYVDADYVHIYSGSAPPC